MSVKCLCWNCGGEIHDDEPIHEVNEELWCEDCFNPQSKEYQQSGVEELANAIVIHAVDDYIRGIIDKHKAKERLMRAESTILECETFFKSEWYAMLTEVDPQKIMDIAVIQANYLMWQQKKRLCQMQVYRKRLPSQTS